MRSNPGQRQLPDAAETRPAVAPLGLRAALFERVGKAGGELEGVLPVAERRVVDEVVLRTECEAQVLVDREEQPRKNLRAQCGWLSGRCIECRQDRSCLIENQPLGKLSHIKLAYRGAYEIECFSRRKVRRRIKILLLIVNIALHVERLCRLLDDRISRPGTIDLLYLQTGTDVVIGTRIEKVVEARGQILIALNVPM